MPTFRRADPEVADMAKELIAQYHPTLKDHEVRIDLMFAFPDYDEVTGEAKNDALKLHGVQALGIAKKLALKERAKGNGDAEISIDGDWWANASTEERRALLDHELHHLVAVEERDDLGRPIIKLRKHDFQFGWFNIIAQRHGIHSQERRQAAVMMDGAGQWLWPEIANVAGGRFGHLETAAEVRVTHDSHGDKLSPAISDAMSTIGNALKKRKGKMSVEVAK